MVHKAASGHTEKTHELRRVDLYKIKWLAVDKVTLSCNKEDACYFTK